MVNNTGAIMTRYKVILEYDGTDLIGWQENRQGPSVQSLMKDAIEKFCGARPDVVGAGRTDAGVHADGNVAVFDTSARMPAEKMSYALNQRLPEDIRIRKSEEVAEGFHPRHCDTRKTYEYRIISSSFPIPTKRLYAHYTYLPLDVDRMRRAAEWLVGEHDFKSFCSAGSQVETTVRTIYELEVLQEQEEEILFRITGNGFLYNMVRIIAGTLIEVGRGRWEPEYIREILEAKNREKAGPTAPACGLMLVNYCYCSPSH